jgi:hypothetical protein
MALAFHSRRRAAILLGIAVWFYLPDRPAEARLLSAAARGWLTATLPALQEAQMARRFRDCNPLCRRGERHVSLRSPF